MFISKDVSGVTLEPSPNFFSYGLVAKLANIQSNFNCSNTFGTMKICSRQGWFEPMRYYRARSGGIIGIFFRFSST